MILKSLLTISIACVVLWTSTAMSAQSPAPKTNSGYAPIHGLRLYYEIHGTGQPLILIHGGLGSTEMFSEIMPELSRNRQVIAIDLQAHGRTADIDRPLSYDSMAEDIAALVRYLGFEKVDIMGYSLGGGVALRTAIQHPEIVRKLIIVSFIFRRDGWYPEIRSGMEHMGAESAEQMKSNPLYQLYASIAPRPADWTTLHIKLHDLLSKNYDWSKEVAAMKTPTMLAFGDADAISPAHAAEFFELLGGGKKDGGWDGSGISNARLVILPGRTHYNIFNSPMLVPLVVSFLDDTTNINH